jgi:RNA 2',3'-cyclic 3'-phosphodiesterase
MMEKVHKSAVILSPPPGDRDAIQAIREVHDRNFLRWMPHITLFYPFYPKSHFENVVDVLSVACQKVQSFDISVSHFQYFQHGKRSFTFWLAPEPKEAICTLQETLWQAVPDCDDTHQFDRGFTPHLSMGQVRSKQELDAVLPDLQASWEGLVFQAQHVDLVWRNDKPDDVFRVGYSISLGTGEVQRVNM